MLIYGLILLLGAQLGMSNASAKKIESLGKLANLQKERYEVMASYKAGSAKAQAFKSGIFHLKIQRGGHALKSFAVIESPEEISRSGMKVSREEVRAAYPNGTVIFSPETGKLKLISENGADVLDLNNYAFSDSGLTAEFDIHNAKNFYGLGEKTLPYNRYGTRWTMWNSDFPAYSVKFDPLYESVPFLLKADAHGAYGLFFDNPSRTTFDVGATESGKFTYTAGAGDLDLYIITGKDAAEIVRKFAELTGKMHMPPIWSLGYQQSRWSYYPESKVLTLARDFRKNQIPCDVIFLDIDYMDGYRCFTWSPKNFPTPKEMLDTLHDMGFKVVTIIDPGIKNDKSYRVFKSGMKKDVFVRTPDGKYFVGRVWPGDCVFPDFLRKEAREWWGDQYKFLVDYGVDGFWNDMNEPSVFDTPNKTFPPDVLHDVDGDTVEHYEVHNLYGMQMARGTREGLERLEPNKRPFVLTRANYAGGQRYAAMWTGDNFASFAHLRLALAMFLNIGVSGQPFVGSDVGGFVGNPSPELFTRWLELGAFTPFYRTHSTNDSKPREPWVFGPEYTKINREVISRRYEMLPEIYTAFREANKTGLPIVRPLYLDFPKDNKAYAISDEFMFGGKILVAPVLDSGVVKRSVYLPAGRWMRIDDRSTLDGGSHVVDAPLGRTPAFVREGTVLFTQSLIQSTSEQADTLYVNVFGNKSAKGNAYFDDGATLAYRNGDFLNLNVSYKSGAREADLEFESSGGFKPGFKEMGIKLESAHPFRSATAKTSDGRTLNGSVKSVGGNLVEVVFPYDPFIRSVHLE